MRHVQRLEQLRFDEAMGRAMFDSDFLAVQQLEKRQRQRGRAVGVRCA
jgi:hypothetical protein